MIIGFDLFFIVVYICMFIWKFDKINVLYIFFKRIFIVIVIIILCIMFNDYF